LWGESLLNKKRKKAISSRNSEDMAFFLKDEESQSCWQLALSLPADMPWIDDQPVELPGQKSCLEPLDKTFKELLLSAGSRTTSFSLQPSPDQ
jgi:hypothetical protein